MTSTSRRRRAAAWVKDDPVGVEFTEMTITAESLTATGVAIGSTPVPYRLDFDLETRELFTTARLRVTTRRSSATACCREAVRSS